METFEIKRRHTGAILYTAQAATLRAAVEKAVAAGASLDGANLDGANLGGANLYRASLDGASLGGASLYKANLDGASLYRANLDGANLDGASLEGANLPGFQIPQEGVLIVWKKLRRAVLAKLLIPAEAARTATPVGRKCRAAYAQVLRIEDAAGGSVAEGYSMHDGGFCYRVGETVTPASYDADVRQECLPGIHFFQTKEEAQAYKQPFSQS